MSRLPAARALSVAVAVVGASLIWLGLGLAGRSGWAAAPALAESPPFVVCPAAMDPARTSAGIGGLFGGKDGWIFRGDADLHPTFHTDDLALESLRRFTVALRRRGTTLVLVLLPPRGLLAPEVVDPGAPFDLVAARASWEAALQRVRSTGVIVPDIRAAQEAQGSPEAWFHRDHHWTSLGARLAAEAVAAAVAPDTLGLPRSTFETTEGPPYPQEGSLRKKVEELCGPSGWPGDSYRTFHTRSTAAADLLGESFPAVVVVGTSNANKNDRDLFNFGGWLSEALHTEVANWGVDGGGPETSLQGYLDTEEARAHPPKLLIWEIPGHVSVEVESRYREALATLEGPCTDAEALALGGGAVDAAGVELLPPDTKLQAAGGRITLEASDLAFLEFNLNLRYDRKARQGTEDRFPVRRSPRQQNNGRYFVGLDVPDGASLVGVRLVPKGPGGGTVKLRVCPAPKG